MESPKYLIIITLIDGQNFTVPDGAPEKIEASVFAEARFGNESILKSDPIKLTNSNPEFVTELAWQLDKRNLHQLRVERRAIKLQVFMQTRERKKTNHQSTNGQETTNGFQSGDASSTHKVELIGYTIIDIRSAQDSEQPKFSWLPLLNPKFRKPSYNRPEVQLAVTLNRIEDDADNDISNLPSTSAVSETDSGNGLVGHSNWQSDHHELELENSNESKLYKTCLDATADLDQIENDEIIENDINIISKDGCFYIYDTKDIAKSTIDKCSERYEITITIPFSSELDLLVGESRSGYYFSVNLFGATKRTVEFEELTSIDTKEVKFEVLTTDSTILSTYFELHSNLAIKLHGKSGESLGIATIQLDQLCSLDAMRRSIEGIFALQSIDDHEIPSAIHPSIGASIVLERVIDEPPKFGLVSDEHIKIAKEHFGPDIDDYLFKTLNDSHQLTLDHSGYSSEVNRITNNAVENSLPKSIDHHFRFTIDLKNFSYTQDQRLIPTLRELVVRYSYPFFGYKDTITTDASINISPSKSIIVSGFCEFNFATTIDSLLTALREIPLNLEILTCDQVKRLEMGGDDHAERMVATCDLNLADTMCLNEYNIMKLQDEAINTTISAPIHELNGGVVGELQIYLSLKDLGQPTGSAKIGTALSESIETGAVGMDPMTYSSRIDAEKFDTYISEAKSNFEAWKSDFVEKLSEEIRIKENERFKRVYQRLEAREAKRTQEFRKKMDDLTSLEKRLKNSFSYIESLEKKMLNNFDQLRAKDGLLDTRLDSLSKAINDVKSDFEKRLDLLPTRQQLKLDDNQLDHKTAVARLLSKPRSEASQVRRSSLKGSNNSPGIPLPVRSSSLVRPNDGSTTRLVWKPTGVVATVVNCIGPRPRSNSTRMSLSKEAQEKLVSLRKEKAQLLKRGCKPNDELIQEINSMIEKLAC